MLLAWHDFSPTGSRIVYSLAEQGCVGELRVVDESLVQPIHPSVAATGDGFVLAYHAGNAIRTVRLAPDGTPLGAPETIGSGSYARVSAWGDQIAFAWLDATGHGFATRGPLDSVAATHVNNPIASLVVGASPRLAVDAQGTVFLAYRDGSSTTQEVFLLTRPRNGSFGAKVNLSSSPNLLSDDVNLVVEPDGTLDIVWIEQEPMNGGSFEVQYRRRPLGGPLTAATRYATQGLWSWNPSVVPGMAAVWRTGQGAAGPLSFTTGGAPAGILPGESASLLGLVRSADGVLHLLYQNAQTPRQIVYATHGLGLASALTPPVIAPDQRPRGPRPGD